MAVERVREGEAPSAVISSYGFSRTTIYKWLGVAAKPGVGVRGLTLRSASGRPRSLTVRQEQQVFRWINGNDPRQYGLDFGLWTRKVAADLIERKFGVRLGLTAVGELLAKLNLTPQKPLSRAYQRDPEAIETWRREVFPAIVRQANAEGAEVFFWDESGFRADAAHGRTWGVKGRTPVVERSGQQQSVSAASAANAKGEFWHCAYQGGLTGDLFVDLLGKMMRRRLKPVHLIVDELPAHKTSVVRRYAASTKGRLTLHFLPGYAPELNSDELVWSHVKRTGVYRAPLRNGESLLERSKRNSTNSRQPQNSSARSSELRVSLYYRLVGKPYESPGDFRTCAHPIDYGLCSWRPVFRRFSYPDPDCSYSDITRSYFGRLPGLRISRWATPSAAVAVS